MRKTVWIRIVTCWEGWECRRSLGHWASQRGKDFTQSMHDQHRAAGWLRKDISSRERGGLTWRGGRNWKPTLPTSRFYLFALGSSNNTIPSDTMFEVVFPRNVSESALTSSWSFETARSEAQIRRNSSCCRNSLRSSSYLTVFFFRGTKRNRMESKQPSHMMDVLLFQFYRWENWSSVIGPWSCKS